MYSFLLLYVLTINSGMNWNFSSLRDLKRTCCSISMKNGFKMHAESVICHGLDMAGNWAPSNRSPGAKISFIIELPQSVD